MPVLLDSKSHSPYGEYDISAGQLVRTLSLNVDTVASLRNVTQTLSLGVCSPASTIFADGNASLKPLPNEDGCLKYNATGNAEAIAWQEASVRWQNKSYWRRSETATKLHRSGGKAGIWTSSSRSPGIIATTASGCNEVSESFWGTAPLALADPRQPFGGAGSGPRRGAHTRPLRG